MNSPFERQNSVAFSSSITCLDGIPFKISPQFKPPPQIRIDPDLQISRITSSFEEEYNFATEEGVLKWADERQRQLRAQQRAEEERARQREDNPNSDSDDSSGDDPWLSSNGCDVRNEGAQSKPVPPKPAPPPRPAPLLAGISSDILTPTVISTPNNKTHDGQVQSAVDVTQFEKVDDPFDMFERQTLNDLEELKSVFATSKSDLPVTQTKPARSSQKTSNLYENVGINTCGPINGLITNNGQEQSTENSCDNKNTDYENVEIPMQDMKKKTKNKQKKTQWLPPIPPRPSLTAKYPLPPIGGADNSSTLDTTPEQSSSLFDNTETCEQNGLSVPPVSDFETSSDSYENVYISENTNTVSFTSSHQESSSPRPDSISSKKTSRNYVNVAPKIGPRRASPNSHVIEESKISTETDSTVNQGDLNFDSSQNLPFVLSQSPTPRPSSKQEAHVEPTASWNKYTPLPDPSSGPNTPLTPPSSSSTSSSNSDLANQAVVDPYVLLSAEGKKTVDNVVCMGFSRPRASRAVEKVGNDEKEVVEHLCLVNKLTEKGHDPLLSESAVLLCKNNMEKLEIFLSLYKQFQELGFNGERIKEALVKNDLDSERTIDYLTS